MLRIYKFCHAVSIMEYKYTDKVALSLDTEVGMLPLFALSYMVFRCVMLKNKWPE